jgi:hypothetical protein
MLTRLALVAAVCASVLAGCGPTSKVDPAATVTVRSGVRLPDGAPAADAPVTLTREAGAGELIGGFFLASVTLFTACLADPAPEPCRGGFRRTATTGAGGAVEFQLRGNDTRGAFGAASPFALATHLPAEGAELAGPVAMLGFRVQAAALTLPDIRLWRPAFELVGPNTAHWDKLPGDAYGKGSGYRLAFETTTGVAVWAFDTDGTQLTFDPRLLEDSRGGVTVAAKRKLSVNANYTSARRSNIATAGAPPSRGKSCAVDGVAVNPCPLTDGDFQRSLPGSAAKEVTVDLGAPRPVGMVSVRGCAGCAVATSTDGAAWAPLADTKTADAAIDPPRVTTARYVRVSRDGSVTQLRELSVW